MRDLIKGHYAARLAKGRDVPRALDLRSLVFRGGRPDGDRFDDRSSHIIVEDTRSAQIVCACRVMLFDSGAGIDTSYAAQHYDLAKLRNFPDAMVEMGRFCIHPEHKDADILRIAWAFLTNVVTGQGAGLLFGCSSFAGTSAARYRDTFALLRDRHLAPDLWRPGVRARDIAQFAQVQNPDVKAAFRNMPPLLRSYLMMGGWVSDHAVIDRDLGTLHVFTGLEIARIPPGRKRLLGALAH